MKYFRYIIIISLAFVLSFADATYFSFLEISGITLIVSYLIANTLALTGKFSDLTALCYSLTIFFSIFSSLPPWVIFVLFYIFPLAFYQLKSNYFPELSLFASLFFFIVSNSLFEATLLLEARAWSKAGIELVGYFALYNSIAGVVFYQIAKKIKHDFTRGEIRI